MDTNAYQLAVNKFKESGILIPAEVQAAADMAYSKAIARERERHEQAEARKSKFQRWVEGYIERYPTLQDGVTKLGNWSMAIIKLFAVNGLVSLVMVFTLIAEWSRVAAGLAVIEASPVVVYMLSGVMVFAVVLCGFLRYFTEAEAGHTEPISYHWSLRIMLDNWRYKLGLNSLTPYTVATEDTQDSPNPDANKWQARKMSPAKSLIITQNIVKAGVVITALYGSMAHVVDGYSGNWLEALGAIVTTSSLRDFAGWLIGIMITIAILAINDMTSNHVASRAMHLEASVFAKGADRLEALGTEGAAGVLWTYYNQLRKAQRTGTTLQTVNPVNPPATLQTVNPALQPKPNNASGAIPVKKSVNGTVKRATYKEIEAWFKADHTRLFYSSRAAAKAMAAEGIHTSHVTAAEIRDLLREDPLDE